MFTIKHISETGAESIYEADEVMYQPTFSDQVAASNGYVYYRQPGASSLAKLEPLNGGTVYVMNRWGATVAKYDLGNPDTAYNAQRAQPIRGGLSAGVVGRAV